MATGDAGGAGHSGAAGGAANAGHGGATAAACTSVDVSSCPPLQSPSCQVRTCTDGKCGHQNLTDGTAIASQTPGDCVTVVCDGVGGLRMQAADDPPTPSACTSSTCGAGVVVTINAVDGTTCSGGTCSAGTCVPVSCKDGKKNGTETDIDCGGSCSACADGATCQATKDCKSASCLGGTCQAPTCSDGVTNGTETGKDCGGSCPGCPDAAKCGVGGDCNSGVCVKGTCAAPTCTDGKKNGGETGADCGGGCPGCPAGTPCAAASECASDLCTGGSCTAASCQDGVKNGVETGVDCGGTCPGCPAGGPCKASADCATSWCNAGKCGVPTCSDKIANGLESDVDCGGPCAPCGLAKVCKTAADCTTSECHAGRCALALFDLLAPRNDDVRAGAYGRALVDMDGDGRLDWVQSEESQNYPARVSVIRNLGNRTWAPPQHYPTGSQYIGRLLIADFNGDGLPDAVAEADNGQSITVQYNDGKGALGPASYFAFAGRPLGVGDLDGDGRSELVLNTTNKTTIFDVLPGKGLQKIATLPHFSQDIAIADFDGDASPDVLILDSESWALVTYLNVGAGQFALGPSLSDVGAKSELTPGDFDNDGIMDVYVTNAIGTPLKLGVGGGAFKQGPAYPSLLIEDWPIAVDVESDGNLDMVLRDAATPSQFLILHGKGDGTFTEERLYVPNRGAPEFADVDGDCRPDFVWPDIGGTVNLLPNLGNGTFAAETQQTMDAYEIEVVDLDGDGLLDVLGLAPRPLDTTGSGLMTWKNLGARTLSMLDETNAGFDAIGLAVGDFDGDGHVDAATVGRSNHQLRLMRGKGDGTFHPVEILATIAGTNELRAIASADIDGDGHLDLLVAGAGIHVYHGLGNGQFTPAGTCALSATALAVGDFDLDGRVDVAGVVQDMVGVCWNDGGTLSPASLPSAGWTRRVVARDVDGDGKLDLVTTDFLAGMGTVRRNLGGRAFASAVSGASATAPNSVTTGDVDGDGRDDLLVVSAYGYVSVALQGGSLSFDAPTNYSTSDAYTGDPELQTTSVRVADLDLDGRADVLVVGLDTTILWNASGLAPLACPSCGDGKRGEPETCDDKNLISGDGCSSSCRREVGYSCPSGGGPCVPVCGDGLMRGAETCDDQNTTDGDGCSHDCQIEPGFTCTPPPKPKGKSICTPLVGERRQP